MTADAGAGPQATTAASAWRAVVVFVALTALLSGVFWALINLTETVTALYVFALMWMPGVPAVLTCRILGRPLSTLGLGRWNGRFVLIAYLIPIAYCLVAPLGTWRPRAGLRRGGPRGGGGVLGQAAGPSQFN